MGYKFIPINYDEWDRREIFEEFRDIAYVITADVNITNYIKNYKGKIKFYPFMNYCVAKVANSDPRYRMAIVDGKVGYYDKVNPLYTLLRKGSDLFTHKCTEYSEDFTAFYNRFIEDKAIGEQSHRLYSDGVRPANVICTSVSPTLSFTHISFFYNLKDTDEFIPFPTFGKYFERDGEWFVPIATQFHHEVNDGYHAELFYRKLGEVINAFNCDIREKDGKLY